MFHGNPIFNADYGQETLTTLNKMRRKSSNIWTGNVVVTPTSSMSWETVPSENKEVIRLDTCETTMQQTEIRWHFSNPQPMESNCSKLFNLKTDVGTSNQRFKTINQKVEYQAFDWKRKSTLKDNWGVYRSGCPYDFQHFYLLQVTLKVRKGGSD